jgi:hypothetical protein
LDLFILILDQLPDPDMDACNENILVLAMGVLDEAPHVTVPSCVLDNPMDMEILFLLKYCLYPLYPVFSQNDP